MVRDLAIAVGGLVLLLHACTAALADDIKLQTNEDHFVELLQLALDASGSGHTAVRTSLPYIRQDRALRLLHTKNAPFDVVYTAWSPERASAYRMVRFPLTRGLLGKRILAVWPDQPDLLKGVDSIDALRRIVIGTGKSWPDTDYLAGAGLNIMETDYENMWTMLHRRRFDALHRGLNEAFLEDATINDSLDGDLYILDSHILLSYRLDLFFFVGNHNEELAEQLERGLDAIFENGTYEKWLRRQDWAPLAISTWYDRDRTVIELPNPYLSSSLDHIPGRYWLPRN